MPAYVLGALSADERVVYERILRRPENASVMRAEFDACQLTVNALAACQPAVPPEDVYGMILARIRPAELSNEAIIAPDSEAPSIDRRSGVDRRDAERTDVSDANGAVKMGISTSRERRRFGRRAGDHQPVIEDTAADVVPGTAPDVGQKATRDISQEVVQDVYPDLSPRPVSETPNQASSAEAVAEPMLSAPVSRFTPTGRSSRAFTQSSVPAVEVRTNGLLIAGWWIAAVLFLGLAGLGYYAAQLMRERDAIDARNKETRALLSRSDARLAERERLMATLLGGRASVMLVNLRNKEPESAEAQLFWNIREGKAILNVFGLAPLPKDRFYQLWMVRDGVNTKLIEVTPNEAGTVLVPRIDMPSSPAGITQVFLSNEARGANVVQPSAPHIISGQIPIQWP